jgi:hypothetical protein
MKKLYADHLMAISGNVKVMQTLYADLVAPNGLSDQRKSQLVRHAAQLREECESIGLPVSLGMVDYIAKATTPEAARSAFEAAEKSIHIELKGRVFFEPEPHYKAYFENPELFGAAVFSGFPSANNDITEAGTCLALERGTACVMHLMRVVEAGLGALAKSLNVTKQNDWGAYLRKIDDELAQRYRTSGARSPLEQFYAEVAITIDQIRRAWRNPTMHVENSYPLDRAEEILIAVKSFMIHLAKEVSE